MSRCCSLVFSSPIFSCRVDRFHCRSFGLLFDHRMLSCSSDSSHRMFQWHLISDPRHLRRHVRANANQSSGYLICELECLQCFFSRLLCKRLHLLQHLHEFDPLSNRLVDAASARHILQIASSRNLAVGPKR